MKVKTMTPYAIHKKALIKAVSLVLAVGVFLSAAGVQAYAQDGVSDSAHIAPVRGAEVEKLLSFDKRILAAIERLKAKTPPVAITQKTIAEEAGVYETAVTKRKKANPKIAAAIVAAYRTEADLRRGEWAEETHSAGGPARRESVDEKPNTALTLEDIFAIVGESIPYEGEFLKAEMTRWFLPYAHLGKDFIQAVIRKSRLSDPYFYTPKAFSEREKDALKEATALILADAQGETEIVVKSFGIGSQPKELKEAAEIILEECGDKNDIKIKLVGLDVSSRILAAAESFVRFPNPSEWEGRVSWEFYYCDVADKKIWDAAIAYSPANIHLWRWTWVINNQSMPVEDGEVFVRKLREGAQRPGAIIVQEWNGFMLPPIDVIEVLPRSTAAAGPETADRAEPERCNGEAERAL